MDRKVICPQELCTGCYACKNICLHNCISMKEDHLGFVKAKIDTANCVNCNLCKKVCPVLAPPKLTYPLKCYAAVKKDVASIYRCASGGIVTELMKKCYLMGYKVFGSRLDTKLTPRVMELTKEADIEYYKGSLYVQSSVGNTYEIIKKYLINEEYVLFVGTPCQVAGLRSFLQKEYNKLICCDLFCHGVASAGYLKQELAYLNVPDVTNITFRGYNVREDHWFILWHGSKKVYAQSGNVNYYLKAFYDCISLRDNCYSCTFSNERRIGDISFGDFLGLKEGNGSKYKNNCVTAVLINSQKGQSIFSEISNKIISNTRPYEEAIAGGISLREPSHVPSLRDKFEKLYPVYGYPVAIRKVLKYAMVKAKLWRVALLVKRRISQYAFKINH